MLFYGLIGLFRASIYGFKYKMTKQLFLGKKVRFNKDSDIQITESGNLRIGTRCSFSKGAHIGVSGNGNLQIGDNCFFNQNSLVACRNSIVIGNQCIFGPNVTVYDHDHKFSFNGIQNGYNLSPVVIEEGCWIGANVMILRGTHIGEKSVIGAGCVVKGDIPPHSLVSGERTLKIRPIEDRGKDPQSEDGEHV